MDKVVCLNRIAAQGGVSLSYHSRSEEARRTSARKSKSKEPKTNVHQIYVSAQFGLPDHVTNFTDFSAHSNSVLRKRKCSKGEEVKFIPNTYPDALGRKVKMKFETSSGKQWLMEL